MIKKLFVLIAVVVSLTFGFAGANAGEAVVTQKQMASNFPYEKGVWELQGLVGYYWDLGIYGGEPHFDYALESLRIGYMVTGPTFSGWCRGNFEFLLEGIGGEFTSGPASYLVGGNLLFRWNFVQVQNPKWVPYIQIGGGGLYHDADTGAQKILGSNVEAMLHAGIGVRYHLNDKWAIDGEFGYRHISNASTTEHNLGLNSLGGQVGVSYFF
jgi:lipid A 3-O-deacylase